MKENMINGSCSAQGENRNVYKILVEAAEEQTFRKSGHRRKQIMKGISRKYGGMLWTIVMWFRLKMSIGIDWLHL
jgi:hypothetical protein